MKNYHLGETILTALQGYFQILPNEERLFGGRIVQGLTFLSKFKAATQGFRKDPS